MEGFIIVAIQYFVYVDFLTTLKETFDFGNPFRNEMFLLTACPVIIHEYTVTV